MSSGSDILRLPSRLFSDGFLHLPIKSASAASTKLQLRFPVELLEDSGLLRFVFSEFSGSGFEFRERMLLTSLIEPSDFLVDIGAHFGLYSLVLSDALPGLACLAVEPSPENYDILSENVRFNGLSERISAVQCALGNRIGRAALRLNSSMGHHISGLAGDSHGRTIDIDLQSLDALLASPAGEMAGLRPVWLKIDTEGREADVLEGARGAFLSGRIRGVLWEFRVGHLVNPDRDAILGFFREFGFESFEVSDSNMISVQASLLKEKLQVLCA